MTATLCLFSDFTSVGSMWGSNGQPSKQIGAMFGKKFFGPAHSALMFQPNVGMPSFASRSAPVKRSVAMNAAYGLSCASIAWTVLRLFTCWSSRWLARLIFRSQTPPCELTLSRYASSPMLRSPSCPPSTLVLAVTDATLISVSDTPWASTGWLIVKSVPWYVVGVLLDPVGVVVSPPSVLSLELLH